MLGTAVNLNTCVYKMDPQIGFDNPRKATNKSNLGATLSINVPKALPIPTTVRHDLDKAISLQQI